MPLRKLNFVSLYRFVQLFGKYFTLTLIKYHTHTPPPQYIHTHIHLIIEESCVLDVDVVQALLVEQQESLSAYAVSHNVHLLTNAERASAEILQKKKFNQQIQQVHEEQQQVQRFGMEQTQPQLSQADIAESDYQRQFDLVKAYLWEKFTREEPDAIMKVIFCCGKVSSMHGHGMHVYLCTLFM